MASYTLEKKTIKSFQKAAKDGELVKMEKIYTSVLNKRDLIADSDYLCWQLAAESGHAHILEAIYGWTSDPAKEKMVYGAAFRRACENGHAAAISLIAGYWNPKKFELTQQGSELEQVFKFLAMSGKVDAMVALYNVLPEKDRYTMIQPWSLAVNHHNEYRPRILKPAGSTETEPVPVAGICDHILAMEQLVKWWDREQMRTVIDADNFETFRYAVKTGNVSLLYFLYNLAKETLSNESFDDILSAQGYECFIEAARLGDMEILRLLWSWADRQKQSEMLQSWRSNLMRQSKTLARRNATTAAANKQDIDRYNVQTVNDFIAQLEKGGAVANETLNMTDIITPIEAAALQELLDLPEKHTKDPLEMDRQALSHFFKCIQSQKPLQLKTIINSQPASGTQKMLLEHSDYLAFRYAASLASSEMMQHIYQVADSAQRRGMMKSKNYSAFGKAITLCNKAMLDMLFYEFSNNVSMRRSLISSNNYSYFRLVSCQKETRDLGSLQTIFDISSDSQRREMLSLEDFKAFNVAADEGLFDLFNIIYTFSKPYQDIWTEIPDRGNYAGFRSSAKNGHLSTLKGIWNWLSEKNANSVTTTSDTQTASKVSSKTVATLQKVLNSNDYLVFCLAAENQHWDVLMQLFGWLDLNEDKVRKELLNSWNYYKSEFPKVDFEKANSFINKGLGIIDQSYHGPSFTTAPAPSHQVGAASSTEATSVIPDSESSSLFVLTEFKNAVTHNHTEILAKMWASANPGQQQMAIETDQFWCLTECIKNNRIDCFKLLWDWTSQEQRNQFLGESKSPLYALIFIEAGELGRTEILQHVYTTSTLEEQCTMLSAENFEAFQASAKNNHLGVVSALVKLLEAQQQPQQPQIDAMLTSNNCQAFLNGIVERKLDLITLIFESATSKEAKKTLIESGSYRPFCIAGENGYTQVLMMLYDWSNSKQAMLKSFDAYVSSLAIRKRDTPQIKKSYEIINKLFKGGDGTNLNSTSSTTSKKTKGILSEADLFASLQDAVNNNNLDALKTLQDSASVIQRKNLPEMEDYWALKTAAKLGNVEMMTQIYCLVADDGQRASMQNNSELFKSIFKIASLYSQLNVMKTLMKWCASSPFSLQQSLLENEDFVCFHNASEQGRIDSLQSLYDWATEKNRPLMLSSRNFRVFNLAARCGHTIAFKQLSNWLDPKALSSMLSTQNYQIFSTASEFGHAEILDYIYYRCAASDGDRLKLVQSNDYLAFKVAAVNGHLSCITLLFAWIQDKAALLKSWEKHMSTTLTAELRESVEIKRILLFLKTSSMIKASASSEFPLSDEDFLAKFTDAVTSSNLTDLKRLLEVGTINQRKTAVEMNDFWCAQTASTEGHAEIIKTIYNSWCNTDQKQLLLSANKFICFRLALSGLKLDIMELLIFWSDPTTQQAMLAADDYFCFRFAADQGKLDILKKCFEWANDTNRVGMLKAKDFSACSSSAKSGNLEIMKQCLIWSSSLNLSSAVIEANDYVCFMAAAKYGRSEILDLLYYKASATQQSSMIEHKKFRAFQLAASNENISCVTLLCSWTRKKDDLLNLWREMVSTLKQQDREKEKMKSMTVLIESLLVREQPVQAHPAPAVVAQALASKADEAGTTDQAFITAANRGDLQLLRKIFDNAENDDKRVSMLSANNYEAFSKASEGGYCKILEQISEWAPELQSKMIATAAYSPFTLAAGNGHLDVLDFIYSSVSLKVLTKMIMADNYRPIRAAISKNHANAVGLICSWIEDKKALVSFLKEHLHSKTPDIKEEISHTVDYINKRIIQVLDSNDTPATLNVQQSSSSSPRSIITKKPISTIDEYLRKFTEVVIAKNDDRLQLELKELYESAADKQFWLEALAKDDFYCFANASETGRLDVLTRLYEMCPESKREIMLASGSYRAFILASRTNRVEVIKTLWKWCGNKENRVKMLKSNDYECFWAACKYGHLEVMDVIYELASTVKLTEEMLTADNHFAFKMATENHQKSAATLLKAWEVPAKVTETSETNPDASSLQVSKWKNDEEFLSLFKKTVHNDYHVSELLALCKNVDEALKTSAISLEDYWCFANSAECDRVDMLQTLFNLCSSEKLKREMITSKNYKAFVLAAENGNLKSVKAIYEMCSPQDKTDILTSENCRAFILAARRGHIDILEVMLQWASKAQQSTTLFKANRCEAFWISCKMGLVQVVHLLYQKAPTADFREKMMAIDKYLPLRLAIEAKQTSVMTLLISWYTNKDVVCEFLKIHLKSSAEMNEEIKGLYASVLEIIVPPVAKPVLKQDQEKKPVFSEKEFFDAIIANDIAQVRKMAAWATDQDKDKAITGDGFWCLRHAATEGLLDVLEFLYSWMGGNSQLQSKALESSDYACFRLAVSRNRSDVVALLLSWASSAQVSGMIESSQFSTFIDAAQHGYLDIMCLLRERASLNQRKKQIEQGKFAALKLSVKGNQSNSVALLISWIPETSKSWLSTEWKHFFDSVSSKDRSLPTFDLVDIFLNSSVVVKSEQMAAANGKPTILPATIASDFSAATLGKTAAQKSYGDDEIFSLMKDKVINNLLLDAQELYDAASTSQKRKIIENEEHYLFAYCADKGRLEMVSRIFGWGNQTQQIAMLSTRQYYPFKNACKNGHLPTVRKLHDLAEEVLHDNQRMGMFSINNYEPFFSAASNNSLHVMNQLYEWGSDSQKKAMIEAEDYKCARLALENGHHLALILLFSLSGNKSKDLIKAIGSHIESVPEKKRPAVQNTLDGIVAMILNIDPSAAERLRSKSDDELFKRLASFIESNGSSEFGKILDTVSDSSRKAVIEHQQSALFIKAAELGRVEILRKIYNSVTEHSRFALLTTKVYQAFVVASKNGRFAALMQLFNWCGSADQMNAAIEANGYSVFAAACKGGQLDTLMYLYNTCRGDSRQRMISSENFKSACESLEMGQPACFLLIYAHFSQKREMIQAAEKYIRSISSQEKRQHCQEVYESITLMLSLLDPSILSKPTQLTDRDILKFFKIYIEKGQLSELVSLYDSPATTVSLKKRAVEMEDYIAFKIATRRSDTTILRKLFEWTDERQRSLVLNSNNCECFVAAAEGNSLDILNTFLKYAGNDSQRQKLIQADSFKSFCLASENGHTAVMLVLYVYSTQRKEMLEAWESRRASLPPGKEKSIQTSVEYIAKVLLVMGNNVTLGNLDDESFCALFLDKIANNQPNELKSLYLSGNEAQQKKSLEQNNYRGFAMCADLGLLEILKILYDWANETQKIEMISSKQFEPFVLACVSGQRKIVEHFLVLTYLETEEGERGGKLLNSMLSARDALGFVSAAEKGRLDVLESIYSFVDDEVSRKLIKADDNKAFRLAGENGKTSVLMLLYLWSKNKSALLRSWDSYKDTFPPEKLDSVLVKKSIDFLGKLVKIKAPVPTATLSRRTNSSDIVGQFEAAIDYNQKDELVALRTLIGADRLKIVLEKDGAFTHFLNCVERDRLELLQQLYAWLEVPDGQKRALAMNDYLLFRTAVKAGYLDVVDEIVKWSVSYNLCGKMISSNNNEGFVLACEYGHLNVMGRIYDLSAGIEDKVYFKSFAAAANNGHTAALLLLYAWCGKRTDMVKQWEAQVRGMPAALMTKNVQTSTQFIKAVLTRLDSNTGGKSTGDTSAAATSSLLERRNEFSSGKSEAVEKSGGSNNIDEVPFTKRWKDAVSSGSVIETRNVWNNGLNDDQKKVLLQLDNYWAFQYSGLNGRLDMLDLIFHYGNSNQCMEMLASTSTFKDAASNGHIEVLRKILEWNNYDSLRIKLLTYNNCEVFCVAAENGYTEILNCLYEAAPTETIRSKFIEGGNYKAFCSAAENGMTSVLALMYVWSKDKVAIIRAWDAYRASMTPQKKKSVQVKNTDEYIAKFLKGKEGKHSIQRLYLETNTHLLPPGFKGSSTPPQEVLESMGLPTETISRALSKNPSSKPQGATKKFAATLKRQTNSADDYDGSDDNNKQSASQQPLSDELFIHRFKESVKQGSSSALKSLYKSATQAQKTRGIDFIWCSQQAAAGGFLDVLVQLWSWAGDDIVRASMLENKNYSIFKMAVTGGRVDMVEQLFVWWGNIGGKQVSNGARAYQVVLEADDYACFRTAAEMGLLELMARLYELAATDKVKRDMMAARDCEAYISALHKGHVVILNQLLVWADGSLRERFLNSRQILTFWAACEFDCLDLLKRVYEFASSEQQSLMLLKDDFKCFILSGKSSYKRILSQLHDWSQQKTAMLSAWDKYEQGLSTEARQSSFAIKQTTEFVKNVLRDGQFFEKFKIAVADGNLGEMKRVWESATLAQQNRALEFDDYILFTSSAAAGKLDVLRQLYSYASPNQRKGMLNANGFNTAGVPPEYIAFIMASHNGHLPVVNQLFSWADVNQRAAMLNTNFCEAFWVSCRYNRVEVVKRIWELGTDEQKNKMLLIDNYRAFRLAGEYAHTEVLKLLWEFAGGSMNRNDMIKAWEAHKATTLVPIISEGGVAAHIKTTDAFLLQIYTKSKATKTTTTTTTLPRLPKAGVFR